MQRRWPIVVGVIAVVCIIGFIWYFQSQRQTEQKVAPLPEPTPLEKEAESVRLAIEGQDLEVGSLQATDGGWAVFVTGQAVGTDLEEIQKQATDVFKGLHRTGATFADVGFLVRTDELKDVYGRTLKELPIVEIGLSGVTFAKIDWDGFDPKNFERVADRYWVHEEIQKLAEEKKQQSQGGGGGGQGGGGGGSSGGQGGSS